MATAQGGPSNRAVQRAATGRIVAILAILAFVPVIQAGIELIVSPVTIPDFVDRRVGPSTTLVAMDGYALLAPLPAQPPPPDTVAAIDGAAYHWYAVRDSVADRRIAMVRSPLAAETLLTRTVIARIVDDAEAVTGALRGLTLHGESRPNVSAPLLDEVDEPDGDIRTIDSVAQLAGTEAGDLVRIRLHFGPGVASCLAADSCAARRLADGIGSWDNLANDPETGDFVMVRTSYPPSVAPFGGVGVQAANRAEVEELLASVPARGLLDWARVLRGANVEHDLGLPIDRLWLGPLLFATMAALLFGGMRVGYPRFRITETAASGKAAEWDRPVGELRVVASGRITPHGASPFEVAEVPATLRADAATGETTLRLQVDTEWRSVVVPRALGALGSVQLGDQIEIGRSWPALRIGWFGSQVLLMFDSAEDRDVAVRLVRGTSRP